MIAELPDLSVVIPVYNCATWLTYQLDGVKRGLADGLSVEIIVVDNRSTDGSAELASSWAARTGVPVRVVSADESQGEPHARNVGWKAAHSESIAYCDADDVVEATWVSSMARGLKKHRYLTGPLDVTDLNEPGLADIRGRAQFESIPRVHDLVPFAHGCNMGFQRSLLAELGGFDESYLIGCDIEIAVRSWRAGAVLDWDPDALVHYRLRSTPGELYRQARSYGRVRSRIAVLVPEAGGSVAARRANARRLRWLALHAPSVRSRAGRAKWAWVAGQVAGEVRGSIQRGVE